MVKLPKLAVAAALAGATALSTPAAAQEFNNFIVFGDSLSDTGRLAPLLGALPAPFTPFDRFSNGPVWVEQISPIVGLNGAATSFAFGGASTGSGNLNPLVDLIQPTDILTQIGGYLGAAPTITSDDVFFLWGGANDYFKLLPTLGALTPEQQQAAVVGSINTAVANLGTAGGALAQAGAQQIVFVNLPDLAKTPAVIASGPSAIAAATSLSAGHNGGVNQAASSLAAATGATAYVVDIETIFNDAIANPAKYGFTSSSVPCSVAPGCVAAPTDVQNTFLFFDPVHPTTSAHAFIAAAVADTLIAPRTVAAQSEFSRFSADNFVQRLNWQARRADYASEGGFRPFIEASYLDVSRDSETFAVGYDGDLQRVAIGLAGPATDAISLGVAVSYETGDAKLNGGLGGFDFESVRVGGHAGFFAGPLSGSVAAAFSFDSFDDISRNTGVAGQVARANTDGNSFAGLVELQFDFFHGSESFSFAPLARFTYSTSNVDSYEETGAIGLDQLVLDFETDAASAGFGARADAQFSAGGGAIAPWAAVIYEVGLNDDGQSIETALSSISTVRRTIRTDGTDDSYVRIQGGVSARLTDNLTASVTGEVLTGLDDAEVYSIGGRLNVSF